MDDVVASAFEQASNGPAVRDVWEACAPRLAAALEGDEAGPLFEALEEVARNAALTGAREIGDLLDGFAEGCVAVRRALAGKAGAGAGEALERLAAVEREGAARLAAGYAAGLEETIGRLRHQTEERAPHDPASGAMRVAETLELLGVEADRCRRTALSLGVLGLGVGTGTGPSVCPREEGPHLLRAVAEALRDNVRRYDGVGRTAEGDFLVVLPDVSRRSLVAIAERLRREVAAGPGGDEGWVIALAHYDDVDVSAAEMMTSVERRVAVARAGGEPVAWA